MMDLSLTERVGLPDALRVLLVDYPRAGWQQDPGFGGLVAFWLDRHIMFRQMLAAMRQDTEQALDAAMDPVAYTQRLSQIGSAFLQNLHGHHTIEDQHFFPKLVQKDQRLVRGFDLLDADHHVLDARLQGFASCANRVLAGPWTKEGTAALQSDMAGLERLLDRHLLDEEDLIVPIILRHGEAGLEH